VEGVADPQGWRGPAGNARHAHLPYLAALGGQRLHGRYFAGSVSRLHEDGRLDMAVIHGDGTTTAAKKGGDNLGFSDRKRMKGDKVVAFCDRRCNVIAPFVVARAIVTKRRS
jgi:hypothetical protein